MPEMEFVLRISLPAGLQASRLAQGKSYFIFLKDSPADNVLSWNRELAHKRAVGMAGEFRAKGVHVALGPVVGPLGRITTSGRNWEGKKNFSFLY